MPLSASTTRYPVQATGTTRSTSSNNEIDNHQRNGSVMMGGGANNFSARMDFGNFLPSMSSIQTLVPTSQMINQQPSYNGDMHTLPTGSNAGMGITFQPNNLTTFPLGNNYSRNITHSSSILQQYQAASEQAAILGRIALLQQEQPQRLNQFVNHDSSKSSVFNNHQVQMQTQMQYNPPSYYQQSHSSTHSNHVLPLTHRGATTSSMVTSHNSSEGIQTPTSSRMSKKGRKKKDMGDYVLNENHPKRTKRSESQYEEIRKRPFQCLGIDDDNGRLSMFLCFLRKECIEVFKAQIEDVHERRQSKKVFLGQVGLRCRFCAHLQSTERIGRSSSFPSSLDRIYQSVTMMIRDHFSHCPEMLPEIREQYERCRLMKKKKRGEVMESKSYWINSAKKLGLVEKNSENQGGSWIAIEGQSSNHVDKLDPMDTCNDDDNAKPSDDVLIVSNLDLINISETNRASTSSNDDDKEEMKDFEKN